MLTSRRLDSDAQLQMASTNQQPLRRGAKGTGVAQLQDLLVDLAHGQANADYQIRELSAYGENVNEAMKSRLVGAFT